MGLELQSDLDHIQRCDAEARDEPGYGTREDDLRSCALRDLSVTAPLSLSHGLVNSTSSLSLSMRDMHLALELQTEPAVHMHFATQ